MEHFLKLVKKRPTLITMIAGSVLIVAWTLLRFWAERTIFDLVGQQVLMQSFLKDGFLDATVGATHYILKMFLVYVPFNLMPIDPRLALIAMTLLINVAAYIGIAFAVRSILRSFNVFQVKNFCIALLWLAAAAGSIFWIEFANSRNIEVAAGLWTVALGLRYLETPTIKRATIWLSVVTLTFFMDPLQIYMTGLPLLLYVFISEIWLKPKTFNLKKLASVTLILIGGYVLAKIILAAFEAASGMRVIDDGSSVSSLGGIIGQFVDVIKGQVMANIRLVAGPVEDGGRLRQAIALAGMLIALAAWVVHAARRKLATKFVLFIATFAIVIQAVYFLSGQSLNGDTSRYLIMLAPIFVLAIASLPKSRLSRAALYSVTLVVIVNAVFLSGSLLHAWPNRFSQDRSLGGVATFVRENSQTRFYASMDTALPTMYYYRSNAILPLTCSNHELTRARTFYPNKSFDKRQAAQGKQAAIILDERGVISNYPSTCTKAEIFKKFGRPLRVQKLSAGQEILFYDAKAISF